MSDMNYGLSTLSNVLKAIIRAEDTLLENRAVLVNREEDISIDIEALKNNILSNTKDKFEISNQINSVKKKLPSIAKNNFQKANIPNELKESISKYIEDVKSNQNQDNLIIYTQENEVKKMKNEVDEHSSNLEAIQKEIDKIHNFLNKKKKMYILFRRIMPLIIEEYPNISDFYKFLKNDTSGITLESAKIKQGLSSIKEYLSNQNILTKIFNKEKIDNQKRIDEYNSIGSNNFIKDLYSFIRAKNKLSLLLEKYLNEKKELDKEIDTINNTHINNGNKELSKETFLFNNILKTSFEEYVSILKAKNIKIVNEYCEKKLGHNANYLLLKKQKDLIKYIIDNLYLSQIDFLNKNKNNVLNGIVMFEKAIRKTSGIKTLSGVALETVNQIKSIFNNADNIAIDFNNDINTFLEKELDSKFIEVNNDIFNSNPENNIYKISIPKIKSISCFQDFNPNDINTRVNLKTIEYV